MGKVGPGLLDGILIDFVERVESIVDELNDGCLLYTSDAADE